MLTTVALAGCFAVYDEAKLNPPPAITRRDAQVITRDSGGDVGIDAPTGCISKRPPSRPAPETDTAENMSATFALIDVVVDRTYLEVNFPAVSYDLDDTCTENVATSTCNSGIVSSDGEHGEDNIFAQHLLEVFEENETVDLQSRARLTEQTGEKISLVHVTRWNGTMNDPQMTVWFGTSADFETTAADGNPRFDGSDIFYPRRRNFADGDLSRPLIVDTAAYINDGIVVTNIPALAFQHGWFTGNTEMDLTLREAIATARLTEDGTLEDVVIAGRLKLSEFLEGLSNAGTCPGSGDYNAAEFVANQFLDIRGDARSDGAGAACDALSFGIGYSGVPVILGSEPRLYEDPFARPPCGS